MSPSMAATGHEAGFIVPDRASYFRSDDTARARMQQGVKESEVALGILFGVLYVEALYC